MNNKKIILGSILSGAIIGTGSLNANPDGLNFKNLGSGGEVRAELLSETNSTEIPRAFEMNCGSKDAKKAESKSAEGKCGEGNCGDKDAKSKDAKAKEGKTHEAKCGEDSCGGDTKSAKSKEKESKSGDATCA